MEQRIREDRERKREREKVLLNKMKQKIKISPNTRDSNNDVYGYECVGLTIFSNDPCVAIIMEKEKKKKFADDYSKLK